METKRGLAGSKWAPQNSAYHTSHYGKLPQGTVFGSSSTHSFHAAYDDWDCPSCGFSNFAWRRECYKCQHFKDTPVRGTDLSRTTNGNENQRPFADSHGHGLAGSTTSGTTQSQNHSIANDPGAINSLPPARGALSKSRWAPRSRAASMKYGDKTWTRVIPETHPNPSNQTPPSLDLGLPYEVQHYTLQLLQRILEEGSFAIASRWLPAQLAAKGWSCSEAVELSAWREFLPAYLPTNALHRVEGGGVTLEQGLVEAVRIRNKAVHRHLVDNNELRGLCWKAERLMGLYGDVIRQEKCNRLQAELRLWDDMAKADRDEARRKLEMALVEIGERPVGEMDWAPNELSLAEVAGTDQANSRDEDGKADESTDDMMELD